jgi:septal ring factor EnvC (AmiA/AmiB activator)
MIAPHRLRGAAAAAVFLALGVCACGSVKRSAASRSAESQDKSRRPAADQTGACSLANQELAELNRQIARLSGLITAAAAGIQELRSSRDQAAQGSIDSKQHSCQTLLQSIQALNEIRVDLAHTCPIRFDGRDIPAATACN